MQSYADTLRNHHPANGMSGMSCPAVLGFLYDSDFEKKMSDQLFMLSGYNVGWWLAFIDCNGFLCLSFSIFQVQMFDLFFCKIARVSNQSLIFIVADSEKFHEMALATETPPKQCFLLDDDGDFPPIGSTKSD